MHNLSHKQSLVKFPSIRYPVALDRIGIVISMCFLAVKAISSNKIYKVSEQKSVQLNDQLLYGRSVIIYDDLSCDN